jgi:hypothetical protein
VTGCSVLDDAKSPRGPRTADAKPLFTIPLPRESRVPPPVIPCGSQPSAAMRWASRFAADEFGYFLTLTSTVISLPCHPAQRAQKCRIPVGVSLILVGAGLSGRGQRLRCAARGTPAETGEHLDQHLRPVLSVHQIDRVLTGSMGVEDRRRVGSPRYFGRYTESGNRGHIVGNGARANRTGGGVARKRKIEDGEARSEWTRHARRWCGRRGTARSALPPASSCDSNTWLTVPTRRSYGPSWLVQVGFRGSSLSGSACSGLARGHAPLPDEACQSAGPPIRGAWAAWVMCWWWMWSRWGS